MSGTLVGADIAKAIWAHLLTVPDVYGRVSRVGGVPSIITASHTLPILRHPYINVRVNSTDPDDTRGQDGGSAVAVVTVVGDKVASDARITAIAKAARSALDGARLHVDGYTLWVVHCLVPATPESSGDFPVLSITLEMKYMERTDD